MLAIAAFAFTSCEDVPMPYDMPGTASGTDEPIVQLVGDGTVANPYNVASALYLITEGKITEDLVYAEGIISKIDEIDTSTRYGNATYYISDDGTTAKQLEVYRGYSLGGAKFKSDTEIKVGDKVIIYGQLVYHNQKTPEFTQGNYIYSLNGQTAGGDGPAGETIGSLDNPITCAKALELINALEDGAESDGYAYVKGKVVTVSTTEENFAKYGNLNYNISDDGSFNNQIQVYSGDGLNGEKFKSIKDLEPGDEVVVYGKLCKYVNNSGYMTPEINKGNYIVKFTKGTGGGDTPTIEFFGTADAPLTVTEANTLINVLGNNETSPNYMYVKGTIKEIITSADDIVKFKNCDYIITDGTQEVKVYRGKYFNDNDFTSGDQIKVGDEVVVYGGYMKYEKNGVITNEIIRSRIVKLNGQSDPGSAGPSNIGIIDGNTITVVSSETGIATGNEMGTIKLADGTTLAFNGGSNTNVPKYYTTGSAVRMYPNNSLTISASKDISSVVFTCIENDGTICNAGKNVTASAGSISFDDKDIKVTNIDNKAVVITNTSTTTGAASQIRFEKLVITYK